MCFPFILIIYRKNKFINLFSTLSVWIVSFNYRLIKLIALKTLSFAPLNLKYVYNYSAYFKAIVQVEALVDSTVVLHQNIPLLFLQLPVFLFSNSTFWRQNALCHHILVVGNIIFKLGCSNFINFS